MIANSVLNLDLRYIDDDEGIKKYFAAFHLHDTVPAAIVIDNFGDFFDERYFNLLFYHQLPCISCSDISLSPIFIDSNCQERHRNPRGRDLAMVHTLALCHNAMTHAK